MLLNIENRSTGNTVAFNQHLFLLGTSSDLCNLSVSQFCSWMVGTKLNNKTTMPYPISGILFRRSVIEIGQSVIGRFAILMADLMARLNLSEECSGNQNGNLDGTLTGLVLENHFPISITIFESLHDPSGTDTKVLSAISAFLNDTPIKRANSAL